MEKNWSDHPITDEAPRTIRMFSIECGGLTYIMAAPADEAAVEDMLTEHMVNAAKAKFASGDPIEQYGSPMDVLELTLDLIERNHRKWRRLAVDEIIAISRVAGRVDVAFTVKLPNSKFFLAWSSHGRKCAVSRAGAALRYDGIPLNPALTVDQINDAAAHMRSQGVQAKAAAAQAVSDNLQKLMKRYPSLNP